MVNWDLQYAKAVALLPELGDESVRVLEIGAIDGCRKALADGPVVIAMADTVQLNVAEHYMREHFTSHYLAAITLVLERHPRLSPFVLQQFACGTPRVELPVFVLEESVFS